MRSCFDVGENTLESKKMKMADLFFSLFCKQVAFCREPVLFKGGFLVPAFKRGSPKFLQNYRSLFVSSMIGKALHSIYRADLVVYFESQRLQLQVGGIPGQGTTQPVHVYGSFSCMRSAMADPVPSSLLMYRMHSTVSSDSILSVWKEKIACSNNFLMALVSRRGASKSG